MNRILLSTALASLVGGAASAQMVFEQGEVSLAYYNYPSNPSVAGFVLDARGAYQIGQIGVQLDGTATVVTDFIDTVELYSVVGHAYKTLANGTKLGGYLTAEFIGGIANEQLYGYGVEALLPLGALDIEAYVGGNTIIGFGPFGNAGIQAYYSLSQSFELSAGANILWDSGGSTSFYNLGAEYTFSNIPISLGASYTFGDAGSTNAIGISASYSFGQNQEGRLFGNRIYPLIAGL